MKIEKEKVGESTLKVRPIGEILMEFAKKEKITQVEIAGRLGVSQNGVSAWIRIVNVVSLGLIQPLSELLGLPVDFVHRCNDAQRDLVRARGSKSRSNEFLSVEVKISLADLDLMKPVLSATGPMSVSLFVRILRELKEKKEGVL